MTLTPHQLAELREAKERATPGEWSGGFSAGGDDYIVKSATAGRYIGIVYGAEDDAKALRDWKYIVLLANSADALLDAAEENARLREALEWYATTNAPEVARTALKGTP